MVLGGSAGDIAEHTWAMELQVNKERAIQND
jgi:hypothetical protein